MSLNGVRVGLALTGSFCTFEKVYNEVEKLVKEGAKVTPIFSYNAASIDTRFGNAKDWVEKFEALTGNKSIMTIPEAEPIGPKNMFDVLLIAPCTENATIVQKNYTLALQISKVRLTACSSLAGVNCMLFTDASMMAFNDLQLCALKSLSIMAA